MKQWNNEIIRMYSDYLNKCPTFVKKELIDELVTTCQVTVEEAFLSIFEAVFDINPEENEVHRAIVNTFLRPSIRCLQSDKYRQNAYYQNIHIPDCTRGRWKLCHEEYRPFEAFIYDDIEVRSDGVEIPKLGFFEETFIFPAILQDNREWMFITPNEIQTMQPVIDEVSGAVITFGLGMGYFAYMAARKPDVSHVTIVEIDETVISLFKEFILPQFPNVEKITIIQDDAFSYVEQNMEDKKYDYAFVDIWHDALDGVPLYKQMKSKEDDFLHTKFRYWIEKTLISNSKE